jgi:hypothetical protein
LIFYKQNLLTTNINQPLVDLVTITSDEPIVINAINYKFYYSIGNDPTIKTLTYICEDKQCVNDKYCIQFNQLTNYYEQSQTVNVVLNGIKGFFIPVNAVGYYEIQVQILHQNNIRNYTFTRSFSFVNSYLKVDHINVKEIYINRLDNFELSEF